MKKLMDVFCTIGLLVVLQNAALSGENDIPKGIQGVSIGGVWYLSYQYFSDDDNSNLFRVKRGYINIKKQITPWLSGRITPDTHQDETGDYKVRIKYVYAQFDIPSFGFFYKPYIEWGLVHIPWLDFEEHINYYRLQDTMFMERNGLFNSADVGFTFVSLLGGEINQEYQQRVNDKYPGKYGSIAVGLYNGGGYHAIENNKNKVPEVRVTIRPFPMSVPGLQFSYFGIFGKGNTPTEPDWHVNAGFVSLEDYRFVVTGTYYNGKGNQRGEVDFRGEAKEKKGYSFFGELKFPENNFSIISRYDWFDFNTNLDDDEESRIILGFAYHLSGHSKILFDYDRRMFARANRDDDARFQTTMEVHF